MTLQTLALYLLMMCVLCACSALRNDQKPFIDAKQASPEAQPQRQDSLLKRKILAVAREEWQFFGGQHILISTDDETMPHVGYWEDEPPYDQRVAVYWRAAGFEVRDGNDCDQPWSAAFISYVMQAAGVSQRIFPPAESHWTYLSHLIAQSGTPDAHFIAHDIKSYRPQPGDLVCATRGNVAAPVIHRPEDAAVLEHYRLHCDIVVAIDGPHLQVIGGNVRNSVSLSDVPLDQQGYVRPIKRRPWFLVMENRL